jgi:hypothetical protein
VLQIIWSNRFLPRRDSEWLRANSHGHPGSSPPVSPRIGPPFCSSVVRWATAHITIPLALLVDFSVPQRRLAPCAHHHTIDRPFCIPHPRGVCCWRKMHCPHPHTSCLSPSDPSPRAAMALFDFGRVSFGWFGGPSVKGGHGYLASVPWVWMGGRREVREGSGNGKAKG